MKIYLIRIGKCLPVLMGIVLMLMLASGNSAYAQCTSPGGDMDTCACVGGIKKICGWGGMGFVWKDCSGVTECDAVATGCSSVICTPDPVVLSINDANATEGGTMTFTVSRSSSSGAISVDYTTANGTAEAGSDYTSKSGTLSIADGVSSATITVSTIDDALDEEDTEAFTVTLSNPVNATIGTGQETGTGTISDNDAPPTVSISDVTVTEGDSGTVSAAFTVSLSAASGKIVTVTYQTADSTAVSGSDYTAAGPATLTFSPGETSKTVNIAVLGDVTDEDNETFYVNLSAPVNATIADGQGIGTITDDDGIPSVSISDASVSEGINAAFTVSLSAGSSNTITVTYQTTDSTAFAGSDYTAAGPATLTFSPGETSKTVNISVLGDVTDENDETFYVNLSAPVNATIADGQGIGTITDDDGSPSVSISDASVSEGNSGAVNAAFTVNLSPASGKTVTVTYQTLDNTALSGSDYTAGSGTLTFSSGETAKTVNIAVLGDVTDEDNETFYVNLSAPVNAAIADGQGIGTIIADDSAALSINNVTVTEGNAGTVNATFTVSLSLPSTKTVTVNYQTANGMAIAGTDYESASGALSFDPGQTAKTFSVAVKGDITDEDNETFYVNLSAPANATIADSQGIGTITDDDGAPMLSIVDATVTEGNAGTVNAAFTVNLAPASSKTVTVAYQTADNTAIAGNDYTAAGPATVTFSPGETSKTVNIAVLGDVTDEDDETFYVNLSAPVNAAIADAQAVGTVKNDDLPPSLSINDVSLSEGNEGTVNATFTVTLSTASSRIVTAEYLTVNNTAIGGSDYSPVAPAKLTFAPGETSQPLDIIVNGDMTEENDETFFVNLINASNATIADNQGLCTIKNDDGASSLSVNDVTVTESNAGTVSAMFTVTLSAPSSKIITVNCNTSDSTATAGKDYTAVNTTLTFNPGETLKTVNIFVLADMLYEKDETFSVNLSDASNAGIADHQGIGTIKDDDAPPAISVKDAVADEGVVSMTFVVTLSEKSELEASADYVVSSSSIARSNLEPLSGKVNIPAGSLSAVITIDLLASGINGEFNVDLNNPVNATLRDNRGVGLISGGEVIPGDVNDSGYVDLEDIIIALQLLVGMNENTAYAAADMNGDGRIGMEDIIFILQMLADMR